MRPRKFGAPKKGQYLKRGQICPIGNFSVLQVEIPSNNEYRPSNLKPRTVENCSIYDRPYFPGPKIAPFQYAHFGAKFGI